MYEVVDKDTTKFEFWLFVCGKTGRRLEKGSLRGHPMHSILL